MPKKTIPPPPEPIETPHERLARLQKEVNELRASLSEPVRGPRINIWTLVRDYLRSVGGSDTPENITQALVEDGHKLGKQGMRNVIIAASGKSMKDVFKIDKIQLNRSETRVSRITLKEGNVKYLSTVYRYQKKPSA